MAAQPQPSTATEHREQEKQAKSQLIIVELAKRRTPKQIKRLRKGRGKLVGDIDDVLTELQSAGTIKASSQPVVIVVREAVPLPWPLSGASDDDDDD